MKNEIFFNLVHEKFAYFYAILVPMAVPLICRYCSSSNTQRLCFSMKSTNVGMSLINAWSAIFIVRNERHASSPSDCRMLVYSEFTSMATNKDSDVSKRLTSFSLQRKSVMSLRKLGIIAYGY